VQGSGGYNFANMPYRDVTTTTDITTARFSSPNFGRWLSPDPIGVKAVKLEDPQTWNMYAYVRNNPTTLTDPTGLQNVAPPALTCSDEKPGCVNGLDPSAVSSNKQGPGNPPAAQHAKQKTKPQKGGNVGLTVGGTGLAGVGKAGAAGTVSGSAVVMYNSATGASGALSSSRGVMATAGQKSVGAPPQPADSTAVGAYIGAGGGVTFGNSGNAAALQQMTTTFSFNVAFDFGASIDLSAGNGFWQVSVTAGVGYGCCFTNLDTTTKTVPTGNEQ
jgi:RHS repeat-associated protein